MTLVTGAAGHLGNVLVRELVQVGKKVKALILPGEDITSLKDLPIEYIEADVRDYDAILNALSDVETVFHMAGIISISPGKKNLLEEVNVMGTRNVVRACMENKVGRLVYTSSIHALADIPQGRDVDETLPFSPSHALGDYGKSKARASLEVMKGVEQGLNAVIVCPSGVVDPYDYNGSRMGRLIEQIAAGDFHYKIKGAYNFVDVRDVARGEILAANHGRSGQAYLLSGEQISITRIVEILSRITGIPLPTIYIPRILCKIAAAFATLFSGFSKKEPLFTKESYQILQSNSSANHNKAFTELGFNPRPIEETIEDTVKWFDTQKTDIKP